MSLVKFGKGSISVSKRTTIEMSFTSELDSVLSDSLARFRQLKVMDFHRNWT